jgi:hypothetical protein
MPAPQAFALVNAAEMPHLPVLAEPKQAVSELGGSDTRSDQWSASLVGLAGAAATVTIGRAATLAGKGTGRTMWRIDD